MSQVVSIDDARLQRDWLKKLGRERLMGQLEGSVASCNAKVAIRQGMADLAKIHSPAEMLKFIEASVVPFLERCNNE